VKRAPLNLYELQPVRAVRHTVGADGRSTLLVPKFRNRLLVRWLAPRLRQPELRVHLDEIGSFVWQQCDGEATVAELAERTAQRFGGERDALEKRVAEFIAQLERAGHVSLRRPSAASV